MIINESNNDKKYKLVVSSNTSTFWDPKVKKIQFFDKLDDAINFMIKTGLITKGSSSQKRIESADNKKTDGRLDSTSWYDLYKGKDQMTGYTSF